MDRTPAPFEFDYLPTRIVFGRGCVDELGATLADLGRSRALVVCGSNVGANRAVMEPVRRGLGDALVGVFDRTTPEKLVGTVFEGVDRMHETGADVVVGLGSGSAINVARAMCLVAALGGSREDLVSAAEETGAFPTPDGHGGIPPNVTVPTTLAGADLAHYGGVKLRPADGAGDGRLSARTADPRLTPAAVCYDPDLFATTPADVLAPSAMNGFDKGLETAYSRAANPISVAHALHGLEYLRDGLVGLRGAAPRDRSYDLAVAGIGLVQYGRRTNLIHAFGNAVSARYDVQQGTVHGIVAPAVLRYVFERADANRLRLAPALGIETSGESAEEVAGAIVGEVERVRDALGLGSSLRAVDGLEREALPSIAEAIIDNPKLERNPPGIDPSADELLAVLDAAW